MFRLMFSKISSLDRASQEFSHGILYFSVAQKFVEFLICTYRGKLKKFPLKWFLYIFTPLIFFKFSFLENYDRYEAETFRVYHLW